MYYYLLVQEVNNSNVFCEFHCPETKQHIPEYCVGKHASIRGTMKDWQLVRTGITDKDNRNGVTVLL